MTSFLQKLSFFLLIFVAVFNGVALAQDDDAQIDNFYIVSTDDPATGGCTPDEVQLLRAAYTEAMKMVRGAMSDIDTFNAPQRCDFSFFFPLSLLSIKDVRKNSTIRPSDNRLYFYPDASRTSNANAKICFSKDNIGDQQQYEKVFSMLTQMFGIKTVDGGGGPRTIEERKRLKTARGKSELSIEGLVLM